MKNENNLIWHFTSAEALYPILRPDGGILATHQAFMNDVSDCVLCRRVAMAMSHVFDASINAPKSKLPKKFKEMTAGLCAGTWHSIFLTCFSATATNPLLWRCYTPQGGFAIGVSRDDIKANLKTPQKQLGAVRFENCSYSSWGKAIRKVNVFEKMLAKRCVRMKDATCDAKENSKLFVQSLMESLKLERSLAFCKDPFFESEQEVRVMYAFQEPVPISDLIVLNGKPRIRVPLAAPFSSFVKRILVSPLGDKESNYYQAQLLAASIGLPISSVEVFHAPVR